MSVLDRLNSWSDAGSFSVRDLAIYRILFALALVVYFPSYRWISDFDAAAFYDPAPGPFALMSAFPPPWVFVAIDVGLVVAIALVLVGCFTKAASAALTVLLMVGDGFAYSFGKIDHSILLVITPLLLGLAGWGRAFSVDERRLREERAEAQQWPLRVLAVSIGVAFVTAAVPKLMGGWLDPSTQATHAYVIQRVERGRSDLLTVVAAEFDSPLFWEFVDWATVGLEGGLLILAVSWRLWRFGLCLVVFFHVGVLLTLNIDFWMNTLVYGAFVGWSTLFAGRRRTGSELVTSREKSRLERSNPLVVVLAGVGLVALGAALNASWGPLTEVVGWIPLCLALVIAVGYLVRELLEGSRRLAASR